MKKCYWPLLFLLIVACAPMLFAQGGGVSVDRVQAELDKTDQLIEQAEDLISSSDNPAGLDFLERAKQLQEQAKARFASQGYVEARRLTLSARDLLRKALKTNRSTEKNEEMVLRALERAGDKLDRAGEMIAEDADQNLVAIYDAARDNLRRAWDFYNAKQYSPALKLADLVEKAADRIINSENNQSASDANYERRLETVRAAVEQARDALADCESKKGQKMLDQAEKGLELAEELGEKGRVPAAMQALQRAREFATRAVRECRGTEDIQARYQRLVIQAERIKERSLTLSGTTRDAVDRLLIQAYEQLELAQAFIQSSETERAQAALQAAQLALRQAEAYILQAN